MKLCGMYQMRQGRHRFSSLPKIQQELTKLIKNPNRFCNISNTTNVQGRCQPVLAGTMAWASSQALHMVSSENFAKPLRILYQISKLFLNLAQAIFFAMTLPHLLFKNDISYNICKSPFFWCFSGVPTNVSCQLFVASLSSINTENMVRCFSFVKNDTALRSYSQVPIIRPVLINVTGLVFENSTHKRKSSTVIKSNSMIHIFLEQYV